jgi:hypothetical protein
MNIFNIEKTEEEVKKEEARRQAIYRRDLLVGFASGLYVAYKDFWDNTTITPQEQCTLLGTSASDLFTKHATGVQFILTNLPNVTEHIPNFMDTTAIPQGKNVEYHEDGTVTITDIENE